MAIRVAPAAHRQRHLAAQNDVRGLRGMGVIGIGRVRPILPNIRLTKSFLLEATHKFRFIHNLNCIQDPVAASFR